MPVQQPSDPRVHRSRSALESALLELIQEHDLTGITVLTLTRRAGVNRSTFYEHYDTVDELAAGACASMFDELIAAAQLDGALDEPSQRAALARVFAHVAENARLYGALLGDGGSSRVVNHIHQRLAVAVHFNGISGADDAWPHSEEPPEIPYDPEAVFLAGALLGTILDWLRRGCPGSAEEMSDAIRPLLLGAVLAGGTSTRADLSIPPGTDPFLAGGVRPGAPE
ncbi:TetR/AcrR family transcriptional regulator [Yinghuangia sp. ASG 101]|uniref:TetR/AcrR family transcriptional regulator n=1 Tax=Yinghuangia sp. ASG 101 TaxID=2896848 RepID=UPI001E29E579|nr:TetR/AcrR family transcriptional regulator [Yinghuangia sp. ASG 101]UGQ12223.1 TetR/AcrR family transcriptional regulator [Yinghuangia sp. ASG 101]